MGKYYCIIYTKDNRRIQRVIHLKPQTFGFLEPNKHANDTNEVIKSLHYESSVEKRLPNVEIIPIENDSDEVVQKFNCTSGKAFITN